MMRAVVFGAGLLGCGLVAPALRAAADEVTFVVRDPAVATHLTRLGGYRIRLVDGAAAVETELTGVRGVAIGDAAAVSAAIAHADLVATAVGLGGVPEVAPALAAGLAARGPAPLDVLTFENGSDPAGRLAGLVAAAGPLPSTVGIAGALAERIVSRRLGDPTGSAPMTFVADPTPDFTVDGHRLRTPLPALPGMTVTADYQAALRRKLSMFSAGHAAAAYLGALKGCLYVHAAVRDPQVAGVVADAVREAQAGLAGFHGSAVAGGPDAVDRLMRRYANAALDDPVERVARDPVRKLAAGERVVGSAVLAEEAGVRPDALARVAAAALCFFRRTGGTDPIGEVLVKASGLSLDRGLGARVFDDS